MQLSISTGPVDVGSQIHLGATIRPHKLLSEEEQSNFSLKKNIHG